MKASERAFLRPLWRRVILLCVCVFWAFIEWLSGSAVWLLVASGAVVYVIVVYFFFFDSTPDIESDE